MDCTPKYNIEKGVAVPVGCKTVCYPFGLMETGDSFLVTDRKRASVSAAANNHGRRHGKRFITRTVSEGATRVWRVK